MAEDARQVRTRAKMTDALMRLLSRGGLESISVSMLCEEAGVHRTTFYGHAASIEEFAVDVATREIDALSTLDATGTDPRELYRGGMVSLLAEMGEKRAFYRVLFNSPWGGALHVAVEERLEARVRTAIDVLADSLEIDVPEERDEAAAFMAGGLVAAIVRWVRSDDTDVEDVARRTQALMPAWWPVA